MLNVSSGGLTFYGGFLFATPVLILYAVWKKVPVLKGMDIVAPCLMLGLAFGRMGCFLNGCCHGATCDLPVAVRFPYQSNAYVDQFEKGMIDPPPALQTGRTIKDGTPILKSRAEVLEPEGTIKSLRRAGRTDEARRIESQSPEERAAARQALAAEHSHPVHPAQLYSVFNALLISAALVAFLSLAPAPGRVFALMLLLKGLSRYVLEMLRVEPRVWGPLSYSMVISIFLVAAGILMWVGCGWLARRRGDVSARPSTATA
jgi:phosphatidylglycerol:prolipoprotein diacylglycerol transferase